MDLYARPVHACPPELGVRGRVNSFHVRSFGQVMGMLGATVAHLAMSALHVRRKPRH